MSEEKLGQHYLAALNEAFPGVVLDHAWQTKDQLTVTVKVNYLPEVVEFLYYKQGAGCRCCLVTTNANLMVITPFTTCCRWRRAPNAG